ncbi:hypothetical protein MSAN_02358200 [Mycena sanguinolenta]|uniref:Uncharacterized protein n=1 Tax=Mycena sanguinolenta TaxID=230812 RepID=A0A8H7CFX2_9AGAR|nr:hypothetical protein MSAN_02358200 [Mycena sanguinolenta]
MLLRIYNHFLHFPSSTTLSITWKCTIFVCENPKFFGWVPGLQRYAQGLHLLWLCDTMHTKIAYNRTYEPYVHVWIQFEPSNGIDGLCGEVANYHVCCCFGQETEKRIDCSAT